MLHSNGLVSNKAINGSIGHLHGLVGMVEAHGAVLVEYLEWLNTGSFEWMNRNYGMNR